MTDAARWKATVYVGGLSPQVTQANLVDAFLPFGDIADVSMPKHEKHVNKTQETIDWANNLLGTNGANRNDAHNSDGDRGQDDGEDGGHRGFAYVEFEDADDAKEAVDNMDKSELFGRTIKVTAAKAPKNANEGLGSRTAIWNQESWIQQNNASEEDRLAVESGQQNGSGRADPMQGLEDLDVAGPRPA